MKLSAGSKQYPSLSITYVFIFCIGLACMTVAGYFLIEGLSQFAGGAAARQVLIVGGILFQITESICFISASALTYHSLRWRYILFTLGMVLFSFSIAIMTLAQKTALQTGEAQAQAIDEQRQQLREQIASLDQVIGSYRLNAQQQSLSIYRDSRALGQDSINRAAALEEKKSQLSTMLYNLTTERRQTSADFFQHLQEVTGLPAKATEFYFLVLRSLLLELSGIVLMSFGANLRAYNKLVERAAATAAWQERQPWIKRWFETWRQRRLALAAAPTLTVAPAPAPVATPAATPAAPAPVPAPAAATVASPPAPTSVAPAATGSRPAASPARQLAYPPHRAASVAAAAGSAVAPQQRSKEPGTVGSDKDLNLLTMAVIDLYEQKMLKSLSPIAIKEGLNRYRNMSVSSDTADLLSNLMDKRLNESC